MDQHPNQQQQLYWLQYISFNKALYNVQLYFSYGKQSLRPFIFMRGLYFHIYCAGDKLVKFILHDTQIKYAPQLI